MRSRNIALICITVIALAIGVYFYTNKPNSQPAPAAKEPTRLVPAKSKSLNECLDRAAKFSDQQEIIDDAKLRCQRQFSN